MARMESMDRRWREGPWWHLATTLSERRCALTPPAIAAADFDGDLADYRLRKLTSAYPYDGSGELRRRLKAAGLEEASFRRLLGLTASALVGVVTGPPDNWSDRIERAYGGVGVVSPASPPEHRAAGFEALGAFVEPLVDTALAELVDRLTSCPGPAFSLCNPEDLGAWVAPYLRWLLLRLAAPVLVLELNVARVRGELVGETAEERYAAFCEGLGNPSRARTYLAEYPVLARLLATLVGQVVDAVAELVTRAESDVRQLQASFGQGRPLGRLSGLRLGLGDRHQGGRTVSFCSFESGVEVVYKPRPMAVDVQFLAVIQWLNRRGFEPALQGYRVIDRGDYGWAERVDPLPCSSQPDVERFYRRFGGLLAVTYAFGGTDFHFENVIACGEHPVLVDLETFLHPMPEFPGESINQIQARALLDSVKRTGLLPERYWGEDEFAGVELSGLAGEAGQDDAVESLFWAYVGTDRMCAVLRRAAVGGSQNRPQIGGELVDGRAYASCLEDGFERAYRLLENHRDELSSPGGLLQAFSDARVRYLLRPSRAYAVLLEKGHHPDYLRDGVDRDLLFDRLWMPAGESASAGLERVGELFQSELDDLLAETIPVFATSAGSRDLSDSQGRRFRGFFARSAIEAVKARLERLGDDDLARQRWLIAASFAKLGAAPAQRAAPRVGGPASVANVAALPPACGPLAAAIELGERLGSLAVQDHGRCGWFTLMPSDDGDRWAIKVAGLDLARGLPGILIFLAHLYAVTGREQFCDLGRGALASLVDVIDEYEAAGAEARGADWPGAHRGWGGVAYALALGGSLLEAPRAVERAFVVGSRLGSLFEVADREDIERGRAGGLLALLGLGFLPAGGSLLRGAGRQCADRLLGAMPVSEDETDGLFPKGTAGIAYALLRYGLATRERVLARTGEIALRREVRSLLAACDGGSPVACQQAVAFGLALGELPSTQREGWREELHHLASSMAQRGQQGDDSLATGAAGALLVLDAVGRDSDDPVIRRKSADGHRKLVRRVLSRAWSGPEAGGIETPGLLAGISGTGLALLRLAGAQVPSPLTLEPLPARLREGS